VPTILLNDLLDHPVRSAGQPVGYVVDVRLQLDARRTDERPGTARPVGLLVSPHHRKSFLGYERTGVESPRPIAWIAERLHRGTVLVPWEDVTAIGNDIELRPGFRRQSAALDVSRLRPPSTQE